LGSHESGHLPFEFDLTNLIENTQQNSFNLVVAVNNTLTPFTIPPARLTYGNDSNL
jgi:beta-glucuronidase